MPIKVWNPKDMTVWLKSFDGDSVPVGPKARGVLVANKFDWQIPSFMRSEKAGEETICPTTIVKGRTPFVARRPKLQRNPDGSPFVNNRSAAQMREVVRQKREQRELAAQRKAAAAAVANANTD